MDGATLLDDLEELFGGYLVPPDSAEVVLPLWVLHAHAHDAAMISPSLAITSPTKRCGKTRLLDLLAQVTPRKIKTSNVSSAGLYRGIEKYRPTVLVDEASNFVCGNDELVGILNDSYKRSGGVIREGGVRHDEHRKFNTWAPTAFALIAPHLAGPFDRGRNAAEAGRREG